MVPLPVLTHFFFSVDCQDERSDCENLITKTGGGVKLEEYCNKWKDDPAVKQCPKTCNMCEYFVGQCVSYMLECPRYILKSRRSDNEKMINERFRKLKCLCKIHAYESAIFNLSILTHPPC